MSRKPPPRLCKAACPGPNIPNASANADTCPIHHADRSVAQGPSLVGIGQLGDIEVSVVIRRDGGEVAVEVAALPRAAMRIAVVMPSPSAFT